MWQTFSEKVLNVLQILLLICFPKIVWEFSFILINLHNLQNITRIMI